MKCTRTWLLLGAGALFVASAESAAQDRMAGSGIRVTKDVEVSTVNTRMTMESPGDVSLATPFDLSAYANMNEQNITAHLASGDSLQIQLAQLAQTKATSQAVRDFAATLQTEHTAHLAKTIEIITDEDVGAARLANDPEDARTRQMLAHLRSMPAGANWDAMFLRFQVQHHQNEIDLLNANLKNAHDDDLEDHIEKTVTAMAMHRDKARSVGAGLGLTL